MYNKFQRCDHELFYSSYYQKEICNILPKKSFGNKSCIKELSLHQYTYIINMYIRQMIIRILEQEMYLEQKKYTKQSANLHKIKCEKAKP